MQKLFTLVINPFVYKRNAGYLLLATISLVLIQIFGISKLMGLSAGHATIDAIVSWLILSSTIFFITNTFSFYHPKRGKSIFIIVGAFVLSFLWLKVSTAISAYFINDLEYSLFLDATQFYRFTVAFLLLAATVLVNLIWYQLGEKEDFQRRKEETDRMAKDAELFKLRHQLQPHFLFNSLNSINSLIGSKPAKARTMIQQLSDFLRGTVKREDQKLVTLAEELNYLKLYLDIEQVRFGHRLTVNMNYGEDILERKLPTLILQPLLENAIKFGLYGTVDDIVIEFKASTINENLHINIRNPFDQDMQAPSGTGFGLKSIKRRMYLLYGRTDLLQTSAETNQFNVFLKIPLSYD